MGSEAEAELNSRPNLPLFLTISPIREPSLPSGMLTPPLQTSASVPFRWEEEPGKPRPCTALIPLPNIAKKGLELPPRLVLIESSSKITKSPSPTTVLDGPDYMGKSIFSSSSFRFSRTRERRQRSFDSNCSSGSPTEGGLLLGPTVLGSKKEHKGRGLFGSFRLGTTLKLKSGKKEASGGSSGISSSSFSSMDITGSSDDYEDNKSGIFDTGEGKMGRNYRRNGSFSSLSHTTRSHFWAAIYEGFKHVVPWKSRKSKKEGFII